MSTCTPTERCVCAPGTIQDGGAGGACKPCPAGTYHNGAQCTKCPPGATSEGGARAEGECFCENGFYRANPALGGAVAADEVTCAPCPAGGDCALARVALMAQRGRDVQPALVIGRIGLTTSIP